MGAGAAAEGVLTHGVCGRERGTRTPPHPIDFRDFGDDGMCRGWVVRGLKDSAKCATVITLSSTSSLSFMEFPLPLSYWMLSVSHLSQLSFLSFCRHFHLFFISWDFAHNRLAYMYFTAADFITLSSLSIILMGAFYKNCFPIFVATRKYFVILRNV